MHHNHLPKLANSGFLAWDREAGVVSTGSNWATIAPLVRLYDERGDEIPEAVRSTPAVTQDTTGL